MNDAVAHQDITEASSLTSCKLQVSREPSIFPLTAINTQLGLKLPSGIGTVSMRQHEVGPEANEWPECKSMQQLEMQWVQMFQLQQLQQFGLCGHCYVISVGLYCS